MGDLARADGALVESALGDWGLGIARLARGDDVSEVEPSREPVSYSEENTFGSDVSDRAVLRSTIIAHAEAVARRLRKDGLRARTVVLKLKLARRVAAGPRGYPLLSRRSTFATASDDGDAMARAAFELLDRANLEQPVRLLGVGVTNLVSAAGDQLPLFAQQDGSARRDRLNRALDEVSRRFGNDAVVRGGAGDPERAGLSHQIKRGGD